MGRKPKVGTLFSLKMEDALRVEIDRVKPGRMSVAAFLEWAAWYFVRRGKVPPKPSH